MPRPRIVPHFKVRLSIANHLKMAAVYNDNDLLALWLRLGLAAIARFADQRGGTFIVADRELCAMSGKGRIDVARKLLARLADVSPIRASRKDEVWEITFPNFAEKQGFGPRNGTKGGPPTTTTTTTTATTSSKPPTSTPPLSSKEKPEPRPKVKPAGKGTPFPQPFPQDFRARLMTWGRAQGHVSPAQIDHAIGVVRDWALGKGERKLEWVATIRNGITKGWALEGLPERQIPKGQAYANFPSRDALEAQVESEREERERRFPRPVGD